MDPEDARKHLTDRYGELSRHLAWQPKHLRPQQLGPLVALAAVATALEDDITTVTLDGRTTENLGTPDDLRAALTLIPEARNLLAIYELDILHHARTAGLTWDEIGELTGVGDRRLAHQRYTRLRNRIAPDWPDLTGKQIHHRDGDPRNNHPGNLELRDTPTDTEQSVSTTRDQEDPT